MQKLKAKSKDENVENAWIFRVLRVVAIDRRSGAIEIVLGSASVSREGLSLNQPRAYLENSIEIDRDRMLLPVTGERIRRVECSHRDT